MSAAVPALTNFQEFKPTMFPSGVPAANYVAIDGSLPGGAITSDDDKFAAFSNVSVFQTVHDAPWAVAFRGTLLTSTLGRFNMFGLVNAAGNHDYCVATYSTIDATKYILYTYDGQEIGTISSMVCDDADHTFVLTFDLTRLRLYIDGVLVASQTDLTGITNEAVYIATGNGVSGHAKATRAAIGYAT